MEKSFPVPRACPTEVQFFRPDYRVLVVEDDPIQANLMVSYLRQTFQVVVEHTAEDACRRTMRADEPVDAILMDMVLKNGQGLELIRRMQQALPGTPIVAVSGFWFDPADVIQAGAHDFFPKPLDFKVLVHALASAIARHKVRQVFDPVDRHLAANKKQNEQSLVKIETALSNLTGSSRSRPGVSK